jgi:hypothetical protein
VLSAVVRVTLKSVVVVLIKPLSKTFYFFPFASRVNSLWGACTEPPTTVIKGAAAHVLFVQIKYGMVAPLTVSWLFPGANF